MRIVTTNAAEDQYFQESEACWSNCPDQERNLITIYPGKRYQSVLGFGGAFTQAAGYAWSFLSEEKKAEALDAYFSENGLGYRLCRTHINSCDFSLENYCYVKEGDVSLETFSVECDESYLLPLIRKARERAGEDIILLASPWSPPSFMKSNGNMNHGGMLKRQYWVTWAKYLVKYIQAYEDKGITITYISIQNEPKAVQEWDSCIYTPQEEKEFAEDFLKPAILEAGLDVKILAWDHNKERVYENACVYFRGEGDAVWGEAFHWYSGDHFENLQMVSEDFPEKALIFTEGCVEYSRFDEGNQLEQAEMYAHDMIGNFNHGCQAHIDWNLYLDEKGGPNHVGNFCAAPVMIHTGQDTFEKQLSYYYIGHLSRYVKPQAVRIGISRYTDKIDACAFLNPDQSIVTVFLNRSDRDMEASLRKGPQVCTLSLKSHSIVTVIENQH